MSQNTNYRYEPFISRKPIGWPGGARVAIWIIPNIESFEIDMPVTVPGGGAVPDVKNYARVEYGARVGIWRIMDVLDSHGIRATAAVNSLACTRYPAIVTESKKRGWEFMAHGTTNSRFLFGMKEDEERRIIKETIEVIETETGNRPQGWLSPGLMENAGTLDLLAEHGINYVCDWCNDDLPYPMVTQRGTIMSMPYSVEINDYGVFMTQHFTPDQFSDIIKRQFDVLYDEGKTCGKVMAIAVHPFITGQPFRIRCLDEALRHIAGRKDVWFATGSEIMKWYVDHSCME